jgi:hypothetical protein
MASVKHSAKALIVAAGNPHLAMLVKERLANGNIIYNPPAGTGSSLHKLFKNYEASRKK